MAKATRGQTRVRLQVALAVSDYGYVLAQGRTELEGMPGDLLKNEHIRAAYLGL